MGKVILFYKYVDIQYPKQILKWQMQVCTDLGLKGRIILAEEGINATLGGQTEHVDRYMQLMNEHPYFGGIDFKECEGDADYFPRLRIVVKDEIVHLGVDPKKITPKQGGTHLTPEQVHNLIKNKPDNLVILDTRNTYESKIGKFTDALTPDLKNFRDFPQYIDDNIEQFKDKQVLMYCTGGIRCERATAYLNVKGVAEKVYQIQGGIQRYIEQFPDGYFRGKNYVFDGRVTVRVNADILSNCELCNVACDDYNNCLNANCNRHFIGCDACVTKYQGACSATCTELIINKLVPIRPPFKKINAGAGCSLE